MARRRVAPVRYTRADQLAAKQVAELDYRGLQAKAAELGIPANQSADALRAAIAKEGNK